MTATTPTEINTGPIEPDTAKLEHDLDDLADRRSDRRAARARTTDPGTSHDAASSSSGLTEKRRSVLAVLEEHGPMTDEDLRRAGHDRAIRAAAASSELREVQHG